MVRFEKAHSAGSYRRPASRSCTGFRVELCLDASMVGPCVESSFHHRAGAEARASDQMGVLGRDVRASVSARDADRGVALI